MKDDRLLELKEAHNAVELAEVAGAAQYASDILQQAKTDLQNADQMEAAQATRSRKSLIRAKRWSAPRMPA